MSVEAPERIWVERDPDTGEKRWFSIKGMGETEYVRADKLEELAAENEATRQDIERYIQINTDLLAENERLRRELSATTAERKRAQEACQQISEKAEAALAEKDKEIAALREALEAMLEPYEDDPCRHDHHGYCQSHFLQEDCCVAEARAVLSRNAGGKNA